MRGRIRPNNLLLLHQLLRLLLLVALATTTAGAATISLAFLVPSPCDRHSRGHHRHCDDGPTIIPLFHHARRQLPQLPPKHRHYHQQRQHHKHKTVVARLKSSTTISSQYYDDSILSPSDTWGNIAALAFSASLAQLLGKTTTIGKLLGAPVTAMALTFALSSIGWIPTRMLSSSSADTQWKLKTLLPPGGTPTSSLLQGISLTLATPLLLLGGTSGLRQQKRGVVDVDDDGNSITGGASSLKPLLASFTLASLGTLLGSILAISIPYVRHSLQSSLSGGNNDGIIIASALLAKNIGGGINYMTVCACLGASSESIAAGLCVDNVMALAYFPYVSYLSSRYEDVLEASDVDADDDDDRTSSSSSSSSTSSSSSSSIEALSHAFTLAAVLTSMGQFLNSKLHHVLQLLRDSNRNSSSLNLSLPITTLLTVLFSMYYPPNIFLSPITSTTHDDDTTISSGSRSSGISKRSVSKISNNSISKAGETLGTSLLYLFCATAGAPGWRLKDSIRQSFPSIASFLMILYGVHGLVLWGSRKLILMAASAVRDDDGNDGATKFWRMAVAPQRLLVASSAAIGGSATAAALAKSVPWESLVTPGLLAGNIGYAVATFIGLLFYSVYR